MLVGSFSKVDGRGGNQIIIANDASVVEWLDLLEIHYYAGSISTAPA